MIETPKHLIAFEKYLGMGENRSFTELARAMSCSRTSVKNWANAFAWKERVNLRDIENAKEIAKKTDRTIIATKARYRRDIENHLRLIKATILTAVDPATKTLKVATKTPSDINALTLSYDRLAKLDLLLIGEDTERETIKIMVDVEGDDTV